MRRIPSIYTLLDYSNRLDFENSPTTDTPVYFIAKIPYNAQNCSSVNDLSEATCDTINWKPTYT
jgi:hypothetical protein